MPTNELFSHLDEWYSLTEMPAGKRKIFSAALKLFSEKGFSKVGTKEIAQQAGVSQSTLFKHFHTKEELLQQILDPLIANILPDYEKNFAASLPEKMTKENLESFIYAALEERFTFLLNNQEAVKILLVELSTNDHIKQQMLAEFNKQKKHFMLQVWQIFAPFKGPHSQLNAASFMRFILSQLLGYFYLTVQLCPEHKFNYEKDLREIAKELYQIITA
ncbi:TetR/AcrR family transcriptional regulator [Ligilactobacillus acidipiscis]|uniref:TetR/AcrR family transcriptional regulator n=1 Tax=Ligilactobacillus acidipiscis TaxID=89059 RepID=UPI0022E5975A|nr:TetR/AcrR family transcriptional regulator [Ligilactobacillus acidipiscis]